MSAANPRDIPSTKMKMVNNVYPDQRHGEVDKDEKATVVAGMIVMIPSATPIQQWPIATKTLSADNSPPRYKTPQYINDDNVAAAGTESRSVTTSDSLNCLILKLSLFFRTKARLT